MSECAAETLRAEEDKRMASDERLRGLAEGWLMRVNHMSLKELSERLLHGEVESLVAMLLEVRDEARGRDNRLLEEALERGRETLHKAIQDRADMQARTAKLARVVREWAACEAPEPESVIDAVIDAIDEYDNVTDKAE